ncbi:hypothetical protein V5799_000784 [Amblyomma americanum]|uniref:Uncharacterized protein n=1 Tax=Amblyomma americanum TaxID=6943 RepID=A0AAQ4D223_AMBAM
MCRSALKQAYTAERTTLASTVAATSMTTGLSQTTKRGLDARTLLCTYGDATNSSTVFPPDGLCDLIFFDSAYKGYKNVPLMQGSFEDNIKVFLSAAQGYQNTEFGVAFAYKAVYTPTLFISQGHYAFGDNELPDCKMVPPTMLQKPAASQGYTYDLVCTSSFFRKKLKYFDSLEAAYTVNVFKKTMFVYDNEKGLCTKMCRLKSQNDNLQFGIAVFDLDYEDYNNSCTDLNVFGAFSRLKMVRKLVDYFRTPSASGARCESDVPCPKGAAN